MEESQLRSAVSWLRRGGVVAAATESFFGLLANPFEPGALARVFELKGRAETRASALILPNAESWSELVSEVPPLAQRFAQHFWPGPLTIVLEAKPELPPGIVHQGSVGVRVPGPSPAAALVRAFAGPLTATSANLAGEPPCVDPEQVRRMFAGSPSRDGLLVLEEPATGASVSTLVSVDGPRFVLLREGAIRSAELEQVVRSAP